MIFCDNLTKTKIQPSALGRLIFQAIRMHVQFNILQNSLHLIHRMSAPQAEKPNTAQAFRGHASAVWGAPEINVATKLSSTARSQNRQGVA